MFLEKLTFYLDSTKTTDSSQFQGYGLFISGFIRIKTRKEFGKSDRFKTHKNTQRICLV